MNRHSPFRFAALAAVVVLVLSGCSIGDNNQVSLSLPGGQGPVISPFVTGLWPTATSKHGDQLAAYLDWFRGTGNATPPAASGAVLDPACPLEYDYKMMANANWDNSDGLRIADVSGMTGFYNPARMEVLFLLRGHTFNFANNSNHNCDDATYADLAAYVPVRLNLGAGTWEIDGWASPAATIVVSVAQGFPMVSVANDHEIAGDHSIISPFRLARFQITPENYARVIAFASMNDQRQGYSRKLVWFRESDISPSYAHLAAGNSCSPAAVAFWDGAHTPCAKGLSISDNTLSPYLDRMARMSTSSGDDYAAASSQDDSCTTFSGAGAGCLTDNDEWKKIGAGLTDLVDTSKDYRATIQALYDELGAYDAAHTTNLLSEFAPPDTFGGWNVDDKGKVHPDPGIFAIIAAGGATAMDDTKKAFGATGANQGLVGFVGAPVGANASGSINTVTLSPSFSYADVKTDAAASKFYDKYSLILNGDQKVFDVMAFSTSGNGANGAKLSYDQSPLVQITIKVTDTLNTDNSSVYSSDWLPIFAAERNAGALSVRKNIDLLGDFGGAVALAVSDLMYGIYRATVGGWLSSLAQMATGNLLAVPSLDPYQVSYQRPDGSAVYILNTELVRFDAVVNNIIHGKDRLAGLKGDEAVCTAAALNGKLNDPGNVVTANGKDFPVGVCFQQNQAYALFNIVRGFSMLLLILLIGRYFLALMSGGAERRKFGLTAFFARCIFVIGFIVGMDVLLRVMGIIVAETVLITNLVGTQAGGGTPYSHLWLFSAYLNSPSRDINIFAMIIMAPFLLLGLFILLVSNWLRYGMSWFVVGVSPLWVISLLNSARPAFFYRSLLWLIRLYLIPLLTLVIILILFIVARMLGINANGAGLVEAIVGMVLLIVVAVVPALLAKALIGMAAQPIKTAVDGALKSIESHSGNVTLEAIAGGTTEAAAEAAQMARLRAFEGGKLPAGVGVPPSNSDPAALGSGGTPAFGALGSGLPPAAGGNSGPASMRSSYGGAAPTSAAPWAPPAWGPPGGVPSAPAMLPSVSTPPPYAPATGAFPESASVPALSSGTVPDLERRSLKMRVLRAPFSAALSGALVGANVIATGSTHRPSPQRADIDPRNIPDRWAAHQIERDIAKYGPQAPAKDRDGKPILNSDGSVRMTPGGRPPTNLHDRLSTGLSYLTGSAIISDGFDPESRTGQALAALDTRTRAGEDFVANQTKRLAAMHEAPELTVAFANMYTAGAAFDRQADDMAGPQQRLRDSINRSPDAAQDPAVAGARRALTEAETQLHTRYEAAQAAWKRLEGIDYKAPIIGNSEHVARDRIAFEEKRSALLSRLAGVSDRLSTGLTENAKVLDPLTGHAPIAAQMKTILDQATAADSATATLKAQLLERQEQTLLLKHELRQAAAARQNRAPWPPIAGPLLKLLPRRT